MTDEPSVENSPTVPWRTLRSARVIAYEAEHGRVARDTRGRGAAGDLVSDDGRVIEVKAYGRTARGMDLWLETGQFDEARSDPVGFHVFVVDNVKQGNPNLFGFIDLQGHVLARLLQRARPQTYVTVPFPVAVYDAAIVNAAARQHAEDEKLDWLDVPIPVPDPRIPKAEQTGTPDRTD